MRIKKKNSSYFQNYAFKKYRPKKKKADRVTKVNSKFIVNRFTKFNFNLNSYLKDKINYKLDNIIYTCLYYTDCINFIYLFISKDTRVVSKIITNILETMLVY